MNESVLKSLLLRDKQFLQELYDSNNPSHSKTILNFASDAKLNTLIKFLFMVSNGHIKVKKEQFEKLSCHHVKVFKKKLDTKAALRRLLSADRKTKLQFLYKFNSCFTPLLYTLFNKILP